MEVSRSRSKPARGGDMREIGEFWCMGPLLWAIFRNWPWLYRMANRRFINNAIDKVEPPRPYRLSTKASYTSWETLTDRSYSGRELAPATEVLEQPSPEAVLSLFTRKEYKESPKSSMLFAYFAQWFTDGILRSDRSVIDPATNKIKEPRDIAKNESTHEVDLAQVYGLTAADGEALRCRHDRALLAFQVIRGEEYPPDLYSNGNRVEQFEQLRIIGTDKDGVNRGELLAMGSDAGNTQIGYSMFNALFLRAHNKLAREIRAEQIELGDEWDDDHVFAATRNVMIVMMIRLVIEEYINHISPWAFRFKFDPGGFEKQRWRRQNWMAVEFNLLYRWHCLLPPQLIIDDKPYTLVQTMFKTRTLFAERGLRSLLEDASRQPAGAIELFNTGDPILLQSAELPTIKAGRQVRLRSYNEYRRHCNFDPVERFEDFSSDPEVGRELERLYGDVDKVEFYPGLFAEDRVTNSVVPPMMGRLIAVHAFSQLMTNPLLSPAVYDSDETFSAHGRKMVDTLTTLQKFVDWVVPPREGSHEVSLGLSRSEDKVKNSVAAPAGGAQSNGVPPLLAQYDQLGEQGEAAAQAGLVLTSIMERPSELFAELRAHRPIFETPLAVVVSLYEDVIEIAGRDDAYNVEPYGASLRRYTENGNFLLGMDDSPDFDHDRALLTLAMRRDDLPGISRFVADRARESLAAGGGRIELSDAYGRTICAKVMSSYYFGPQGPPPEQLMAWCRAIYQDIFVTFGRDADARAAGEKAGQEFRDFVLARVLAGRKNSGLPARDTVLARLIEPRAGGAAFSNERIRDNLIGCTVGVIDNVGCAVANAFDVLLDRPAEFRAAVAAATADQDDLVLRYVLEALRFRPAASILVRKAKRDIDLARGTERETRIFEGTLVFAASGSAMMDERALAYPSSFELDRPSHHYLHYGWGMHRCLGSHLANAQLLELAKALLRKPNLRRAQDVTGQPSRLGYVGAYPKRFELEFDLV